MTIYFTADNHFFHAKAIVYGKRPYADLDEMHAALIENWNSRVTQDDTVYVLGDFAFKNKQDQIQPIFAQLNGKKHLIIGNHDNAKVLALPWSSPPSIYQEIKVDNNDVTTRVIMMHYPIRSWNGMYHGSVHLYGHEHGNLPDFHNCCDVGVDSWNWHPVTLPEVIARMANATINPVIIQNDATV